MRRGEFQPAASRHHWHPRISSPSLTPGTNMIRFAFLPASLFAAASALVHQQSRVACDADNGGITLPQGFCALVVADSLGPARHFVVAPNGDLFVAIRNRRDTTGGIVAMRDTNGDGRMDVRERFGDNGGSDRKSTRLNSSHLVI